MLHFKAIRDVRVFVTIQDIATESQRTQREYITTNEHKYKKIVTIYPNEVQGNR
ncbi:MAG: hypothetical protein AB1414_16045 [bacterium]